MSLATDANSTSLSPLAQAPPPSSDWQNVMSAASSTLGLSTGELRRQLAKGSSLSSIASARGVSQQALVHAIEGALRPA